ncbi:MAG: hypothetical protein OEY19_12875 [Gammaproteobacteria bacterium]|nr:hypothetical protein [Gammaproteobacteria bacterium]MDH5631207.1 hypothetical protein [Gammaproteobacteria bacterium]
MKSVKFIKGSLIALGLASSSVMAVDGTLGATSTGSVLITLDISPLVQVTNLDDITLTPFVGGAADLTGSDSFCVYSNNGTGNYNITMSGDAGNFTLANGASTIPYSVDFVNGATTSNALHGQPILGQTGANTVDQNCGAVPDGINPTNGNVSMSITVANAAAAAAPAGIYTGTLTVVVAPE